MSNAENWKRAISFAEGTLRDGMPAYDIQFGGGRFDNSLPGHPNKVIRGNGYSSAAAGAYQFMPDTWNMITQNIPSLRGAPMSPQAQDQGLRFLAARRGVDIDRDPINAQTLARLAPEWASLPTLEGKSYYGQPVKSVEELLQFANTGRSTAPPKTVLDVFYPPAEGVGDQSSLEIEQEPTSQSVATEPVKGEQKVVYQRDPQQVAEREQALAERDRLIASLRQSSEKQRVQAGMQGLIKQAYDAFSGGKSVI